MEVAACAKMARVLASIPYALIYKFDDRDETATTTSDFWEDIKNGARLPLFDSRAQYDAQVKQLPNMPHGLSCTKATTC